MDVTASYVSVQGEGLNDQQLPSRRYTIVGRRQSTMSRYSIHLACVGLLIFTGCTTPRGVGRSEEIVSLRQQVLETARACLPPVGMTRRQVSTFWPEPHDGNFGHGVREAGQAVIMQSTSIVRPIPVATGSRSLFGIRTAKYNRHRSAFQKWPNQRLSWILAIFDFQPREARRTCWRIRLIG